MVSPALLTLRASNTGTPGPAATKNSHKPERGKVDLEHLTNLLTCADEQQERKVRYVCFLKLSPVVIADTASSLDRPNVHPIVLGFNAISKLDY